MREAFSDAEDYLDQGLVSADRCASRTSSISSWSENFRPSFTEKLKFKSVMEGEQAIFRCKLVASPAPKVAWFHNNRPIHKDSRRIIKIDSTMHIHNSSLEINNVEEKDSGSYRIFAINSEGSAEATASLLVALKEEQNANYISFVKRSEMAHKSIDCLVKKRNARLRVDLRHVGSPFDKKSQVPGILHKQPNSKSKLMRTMYFETMPIKRDLFSDDSVEMQSSRLYGRIHSKHSLIDEDIKVKLQLLREAKRRKRFSLAFSEASFDLGTASTEDNLKHNYADLDRGRSRSMGDLDRMDFDCCKPYFVQGQELSSGKYLQREYPEFKYRMEWILGFPSHEVEPQRAPEDDVIEQSCRTKDIHSVKEQVLKDNLIQETEQSQKNQCWLEEQETDEYYFQKEYDTRKELESEHCEEPQALSDQWFGPTFGKQRTLLTKGKESLLEPSKVEEATLLKEIPQSEDSDCTEMLWKKEFPTFTRTLIKQIPLQLKKYPSKSDFKEDHDLLSDKWSESLMNMQSSLAEEIETDQSMVDCSKPTEVNVSRFDEKAEIMRECTQKPKLSPSEEEEITTTFRATLEDNTSGGSKTCQVEVKEHPNAFQDQKAGNVSVKQASGFDHISFDQMKPVSKDSAISISKVHHEAIQFEDQVKDYTPMMISSILPEQKATSGFVSSLMKEIPEVKDTTYKSCDETPLGQQPERFIQVQRDLPTQRPESHHKISDQSESSVSQAEIIGTSQIRQDKTQDEGQFIFSIHSLRHSPLTAKTRESATFARTVIKQTSMETKDLPNEFDVKEESEPISNKRLENIIHAEEGTLAVTSEDILAIQMPDQFRSTEKHTEVIGASKLSQKEQYENQVKDFTSTLNPCKFNKEEHATFVSSSTSETAVETKEFCYESEVEESGTKPPDQFFGDFVSTKREFGTELSPAAYPATDRDFVAEISKDVHIVPDRDFVAEISEDIHGIPTRDFVTETSAAAYIVHNKDLLAEISKDVHPAADRGYVTITSKDVHTVPDSDFVTEVSKDVHIVPERDFDTEISKDVHTIPDKDFATEISQDVHVAPDRDFVTEISKEVHTVPDRDFETEISKDVHKIPDRDFVTKILADAPPAPTQDFVTEKSKDVHIVPERDFETEISKDVHTIPDRDFVRETSQDVRVASDRDFVTEISKEVHTVPDRDFETEIPKDFHKIPDRDFVTKILADAHPAPTQDFVTEKSKDVHIVPERDCETKITEDVQTIRDRDFVREISADVHAAPDIDFVTEVSKDAQAVPERSKPMVKQIEITTFSKVSPELQPADTIISTVQVVHPSLPDDKLEPTSFSSLISETAIDTKEPGYGFELMKEHEAAFDQQCADFEHVQKDEQLGKPEEGHDVHEQPKLAENHIEIISVAKIRQKELQYEAKIVSSPWMVMPSPLPEEMKTLTYVSALKKPSPIGKMGSADKAEFRESHETSLDSATRMHKDFLKKNQEHSRGTSDQSTDGETAMISTSESSQKELQQKWRFKTNIQTAKTPSLTEENKTSGFISSFMEDTPTEVPSSQYEFVATKTHLKQETPAVKHCPPTFFHHIASSEIKQGESCVLECQFNGHPLPTVVWYKDERPISRNRDYHIHSTENSSTLSIGCTCKEHEGAYACVVFNQYGTASTFGTLIIQEPEPKLFEESSERFDIHVTEAPENETVEDHVDQLTENEMESYFPDFAVTRSTLQLPKVSAPQSCPRDFSLLPSPVEIKITAPTPTPEQDEERKELLQEDEIDSKDSSQEPLSQTAKHKFTFSFDVISEPPQVVKELDRICCAEGESVMFECLISGDPPPVVSWIQNDRVLTDDNSKHRFEESGGKYRLYIDTVSASDMGNYKCIAKNKAGEVQSISSLTVQPVVHSFICHLKDTESSDEEAELSVSRFLFNLSKTGQVEDIEQQKQLSVQEGHGDASLLFSIEEKAFNFIPEREGSVPCIGDEFSSKVSSLREGNNKAILSSLNSFSGEVSSLREGDDKKFTESAMPFGEFSSKCSSSVKASNNIAADFELIDKNVSNKTVEETCSISEYLRSFDANQELSEDWKKGKEIERNGDKCASEGEMYEDSVFSESVIQQVVKSNEAETTENVSKMELSGNLASPKPDYDVSVDPIGTTTNNDEGVENEGVSIAQYLLSTRQEEAQIHEEANNETFGYDESGITSMEVEEVTFAAVYDYYNQNEEWTRSLSPESEMSIEISSTISDDVSENERFYTPPLASENYRSAVSAEAFHTPPQSPGYATPPEILPSLNAGRSSCALLERFHTPPEFFRTPIDEGIETTPLESVSFCTEEQRSELFSTPPQETEAKGNEMPPAFIKPLVRKRIHEGGTLTFIIEVIGCPTPNVKWYRKRSLLEPNHRTRLEREGGLCLLVIHSIQREDEGEYTCSAVNLIGEAKSVTQVDVLPQDGRSIALPPPVTHQHVIEFDVQQGQTSRSPSPQEILLEVELDEHEVKEFEKQIKIVTIPEFTPDNKNMVISLDVLPLMMSDEHNVDFLTKDNEDVRIDFEVTEMPPRFISHIFDFEIPENTDAVFECSVTGIPKPEVIWFRDDSLITFDGKKYIRTDSPNHSLKITNVCPSDSGTYTCKTANSVGETTCRGYLTVTNPCMALTKAGGRAVAAVSLARAQECPQELDVDIGNPLLQSNQGSEIEVEFDIEQGRDDSQKSVKLIALTENANEEKGEKSVNISFDVFAEPAKEETIQFKGEASENCSFEFQVTETPPRFVISLLDCITSIGSMASFQCFVTGTPKPNVIWCMNDQVLEEGNHIIEEKDSGHHYLNIANVTESDAGVYKCKAVNKAGEAVSEAVLKVLYL
ncbi:titin-like [Stegostoma tigrinum]|uniref:titin-like n=1 Tax=Stegostoma tigrinum TaxID=3053191 RepID=UPI0028705C10|nr:titin-like [Stegostoma tigrinum]